MTTPESRQSRAGLTYLALRTPAELRAAYMPFFTRGGIFIPSLLSYNLGDDIFLRLSLPDDPQPYSVEGQVAWITPPQADGTRPPGFGIEFSDDEAGWLVKQRIEDLLGPLRSPVQPTYTI